MPVVKLFASLRSLAGKKEIEIPGASVEEVLENLVRECPALQPLWMQDGHMRLPSIITVNGRSIDAHTHLNEPVSETDQIAIFPPIGGG